MAAKKNSSIQFEMAFFEQVLARAPDFIEALICLGDLYTREGLYAKGLEIDERLARLRPQEPEVFYNLACSYSLLNNIPAARRAMARAFDLGYDEWDHLRKDKDLANLLGDHEFVARLKEFQSGNSRKRVMEKITGE